VTLTDLRKAGMDNNSHFAVHLLTATNG